MRPQSASEVERRHRLRQDDGTQNGAISMRDARRPPHPPAQRYVLKPPASPRLKLSHTVRNARRRERTYCPNSPAFTQPTSASASRPWSRHELALRAVRVQAAFRAHVEGNCCARRCKGSAHLKRSPRAPASSLLARSAQRILSPLSRRAASSPAARWRLVTPLAPTWTASTHRTVGEIAALISAIGGRSRMARRVENRVPHSRAGWLTVCRVASWRQEPSHTWMLLPLPPGAIPSTTPPGQAAVAFMPNPEALLWNDAARADACGIG